MAPKAIRDSSVCKMNVRDNLAIRRTGGLAISNFRASNAFCQSCPEKNSTFVFQRPLMVATHSVKCIVNLWKKPIAPIFGDFFVDAGVESRG